MHIVYWVGAGQPPCGLLYQMDKIMYSWCHEIMFTILILKFLKFEWLPFVTDPDDCCLESSSNHRNIATIIVFDCTTAKRSYSRERSSSGKNYYFMLASEGPRQDFVPLCEKKSTKNGSSFDRLVRLEWPILHGFLIFWWWSTLIGCAGRYDIPGAVGNWFFDRNSLEGERKQSIPSH